MTQSNFRANLVKKSQAVNNGELPGNKENAVTAMLLAGDADWRDALMGTTTTDEQLNAEICAAIKSGGYVAYRAAM